VKSIRVVVIRLCSGAALQSGKPVTAGHKIIITKWLRELGFRPMSHD
jgi:hypothetical protein